jgi:hypothetical protein
MNNDTGALLSVGYNTLAGGLTTGHALGETRFWATHGVTTVSGPVNIGTGGFSYFYGSGNFIVSGVVNGVENSTDRFFKSGNLIGTTLWLQNANNTFTQAIRAVQWSTGGQQRRQRRRPGERLAGSPYRCAGRFRNAQRPREEQYHQLGRIC